jgi:outer membrane protein assembly factor BamA
VRHSVSIFFIISSAAFTVSSAFAFTDVPADTIRRNKRNTTVDTSRYVQINNITIAGNTLTRSSIILRELALKPGDVVQKGYLSEIYEKDKRKLFNLHLFHTVQIYSLDAGDNTIDVLVDVVERWFTFPIPIFKLSDRNFNEWWENYDHDFSRVNYGLKLYQYNLWGRNHTLLFTAQFGFQKRFQLLYRVPYINKKQKQGLVFEMDYIEAKNVADSTVNHKLDFFEFNKVLRRTKGIGLTYTYRNNFYNQHKIKYEVRQTNIRDTLQALNPNYLGSERARQTFDALTYEFVSDHRDVIAYPLRGNILTLNIEKYGVGIHKDLNKTEGSLSFAGFSDLKKGFFLANLSFLYASTPDNIPYFNYGAMGYNKIFVRGFEVYVIEGPQYFLNKTTLKKRIFSRNWDLDLWKADQFNYFPLAIYLKAYADWGYVNNYSAYSEKGINTMLADKFIGGAGTGIDFVTAYDVVLRLEYTFTTQHTNGFFLHIKKEF